MFPKQLLGEKILRSLMRVKNSGTHWLVDIFIHTTNLIKENLVLNSSCCLNKDDYTIVQ